MKIDKIKSAFNAGWKLVQEENLNALVVITDEESYTIARNVATATPLHLICVLIEDTLKQLSEADAAKARKIFHNLLEDTKHDVRRLH